MLAGRRDRPLQLSTSSLRQVCTPALTVISPFSYGTRARFVMDHADLFEDNIALNATPGTQFVSEEKRQWKESRTGRLSPWVVPISSTSVLGTTTLSGTSCRCGIGILLSEKGEIGLFRVALCLFMARAASIVCVHLTPAAIQLVSGGPSTWASGTHRRRSHPYPWLTRSGWYRAVICAWPETWPPQREAAAKGHGRMCVWKPAG